MGIANDVKNLGGNIVAAHDARVKAMGTLVTETRDLARDTHFMLDSFSNKRKEMSVQQSKTLADFMAELAKNVGSMLDGFSKEHKNRVASLKASLKKNTRDIENYVAKMLKEFSAAHTEMSAELKKDLAKYVANIVNGTCELLAGFHGEREMMGAHWQAMAAAMTRKRGGKHMAAREKASTVKEFVKKIEKVPGTVKQDFAERVLEFINKHPKGIRVSDMEKPLGTTRIKLGQEAKKLLNGNRVRKEENLYFPL